MITRTVTIKNKLGLHARAATKLAQLSQQFESKVTLSLGGKSADAGSIMGLMLLSGAQGKQLEVSADGIDADEALTNICQLIEDKFDEEE